MMMLTSNLYMPPQQQYYSTYAPPRSSPLSERSVNIAPRLFDFSMASQENDKKFPISQRAHKSNPLLQTRDAATKRRRDMFFKRVQNNRDDKKWELRGEQIQQLDVAAERRRWEAEKARQAPPEMSEFDEEEPEDTELPAYTSPWGSDMDEAEHFASQEEFELQQLIESMEQEDQENDASSQHFGSDDEDYDALFSECEQQFQPQQQQQHQHFIQQAQTQDYQAFGGGDAMDTEMMDF